MRCSFFYNEDIFSTLQSEIIYFQSLGPVLLMGDLNARTGREADYISSDGDKYINSSHKYQQKHLTKARQNYANTVNTHGKQVLQLCKSLGLYIVNGRTKGDSLGRLTYCSYLGSSTVDYAITDLDQSQVKSSHLYLYSAFNNTNCNKALHNIKIGKFVNNVK